MRMGLLLRFNGGVESKETKMTPRPNPPAVSPRRAARTRSRVVFFLLRRWLRRLRRAATLIVSRPSGYARGRVVSSLETTHP